jgi:hypothetical protein
MQLVTEPNPPNFESKVRECYDQYTFVLTRTLYALGAGRCMSWCIYTRQGIRRHKRNVLFKCAELQAVQHAKRKKV